MGSLKYQKYYNRVPALREREPHDLSKNWKEIERYIYKNEVYDVFHIYTYVYGSATTAFHVHHSHILVCDWGMRVVCAIGMGSKNLKGQFLLCDHMDTHAYYVSHSYTPNPKEGVLGRTIICAYNDCIRLGHGWYNLGWNNCQTFARRFAERCGMIHTKDRGHL